MTMPSFERATFGNKAGSHQLLSSTIPTEASVLDQLRFLVDRPAGHVDSSVTWSPYWGCQRVDDWWAIWRGEEDPDAPRKNMVKVEVALLPATQCGKLNDLNELLVAVAHTEDNHSSDDVLPLACTIVQRLSTMGPSVALPDISWAPSLLRTLWPRLWPSARSSLSLRTVFAAESLDTNSPPMITVFPTELLPRWHGQPIVKEPDSEVGTTSIWFGGGTSLQVERLLKANADQLPGDIEILVRVERIVERLKRLHRSDGTVSDALVVARTQQAFPGGFKLPPEDVAVVEKGLVGLWDTAPGDIRSASLTKLDQVTNLDEIETAVATWIQARLPGASDSDALWILQHHLSQEHEPWWRRGVGRGLEGAFEVRNPEWGAAFWHWCMQQPRAFDWLSGYLDGSESDETWLVENVPEGVHEDLLKKIFVVCRNYGWATLLARTLGRSRPLVECIETMRKVLRRPGDGIKPLLLGRSDTEVVTAAAETNWPQMIGRVVSITKTQPSLLGRARNLPGFITLIIAHLKNGGDLPETLICSDFLEMVFDGVLKGDQQLEKVADHLGESAGVAALDHPLADQLLDRVNAEVLSGAVEEWWMRYLADDQIGAPPNALRQTVIDTAAARCEGASIRLITRLLELLPEVSEGSFTEWMRHTGFFWAEGDHQRVARMLIKRDWRSVTKTFRRSWKQELNVVAWYANDLLSWSNRYWLPPAGVDSAANTEGTTLTNSGRAQQMKITFLASNPLNSGRLAIDEEAREIEEKVRDAKHRDLVNFKTHWSVRPEDLQRVLLEDEPVVVHFSGHGGGAVGIVLHSQDQGEEHLVGEKALTDLFRVLKDDIRVVVLNACYSEVQAKAIVKEIDFVIGMSDSVGDVAARVFASAFYRGLAFGRSVQSSFDLGINALSLAGLGSEDHIPQLLVRSGVDPATTILVGDAL